MNGYSINPRCICITNKDHTHTYITDPEEIKRIEEAEAELVEQARMEGKEKITVTEVKDGLSGKTIKLTIKDYT